jgi:hypothetical protein
MRSRIKTRIERLEGFQSRETPKSGDKLPLAVFRHLADGSLSAEESRRWSALIAQIAAEADLAEHNEVWPT